MIHIKYQTIFLIAILLSLVIIYMYFLSSSVVNVVVAREYSRSTAQVMSEITELEAKQITRQHNIRQEIALQDGYVSVDEKFFVDAFNSSLAVGYEER